MEKLLLLITAFCSLIILAVTEDPVVRIKNGLVMGKLLSTALKNIPFTGFIGIPYAKPPIGELRFEEDPMVRIKNGLVMGKSLSTALKHTPFTGFMGIPYAKPPIGELRFELAQPADNWTGIFHANQSGSACLQSNPPTGSENCLFINVYTSKLEENCLPDIPVVAFIHGGGFNYGDSSYETLNPDTFMDNAPIVLVTFNYRLGNFGFLSAGDLELPGNLGLKDQVLALQWIHDNIAVFCGDPNKVTIMGNSAGAASVGLHLGTPNSGVLFHAAVQQSGTDFCDWSRDRSQALRTLALFLLLNGTTTHQLKQQLKLVPAQQLQSTAETLALLNYGVRTVRDGLVFGPVIEPPHATAFKTKFTFDSWEKGLVPLPIPVMIGGASQEINVNSQSGTNTNGLLFDLMIRVLQFRETLLLPDLVPISMNISNIDILTRTFIGTLIRNKYQLPLLSRDVASTEFMTFFSHDLFIRPIMKAASLYHQNNYKVYVYIMHYCGDSVCMSRAIKEPGHSEEMFYLFNNGTALNQRDNRMREIFGTLWSNFAKFHDPTIAGLQFQWQETDENLRYLDINDNSGMVGETWQKEYLIDFWEPVFKNWSHPPLDTY